MPERRLLLAILITAITDAYGLTDIDRHLRREARHWLNSSRDKEWSFIWVCNTLDLCPKTVLARVLLGYELGDFTDRPSSQLIESAIDQSPPFEYPIPLIGKTRAAL